jgi:hypothetical protein
MWIITRIGFFNIIQYDEDKAKDLLTVKARSREDLDNFKNLSIRTLITEIEESQVTDYQFRLKAPRDIVIQTVAKLVDDIDYGKTKPAISEKFPERAGIYFGVWDRLYEIQCLKGNT